MVTLTLDFENGNKFYFEGETLVANLEVSVNEPVNISNIYINIVGECCCSSSSGDRDSRTKSSKRNEKEIYFDDVLPLFVAAQEETSLFKGAYPFTVKYQLPTSLPTSLECPQGYIRYSLRACADVGGTIVKSVQYFTVVSKVDLNDDESANLPAVLWKSENQCIFSFLCLRSGQIRAFVHVGKRGFVPGETLTINAEVWNFNTLPVNWVKAVLVQILKCNYPKVGKRKRVVVEVTRGCIMPYDNQTWRGEGLCIPAIPPTTIPGKSLINVKYKLYFLIKTSWQDKTITLKQDIVVGAVPLVESKGGEERGQGEGGSKVTCSYHYSDLEPCIFGPYTIEDENSVFSFSPLYPVYT